jgi:hypothetical protein
MALKDRSRLSPSQKGRIHHVIGAGPRRTLRKFFGLSDADTVAALAEIERLTDANLKRVGPHDDLRTIVFMRKDDWERVGKLLRDRIVQRTLKGLDENEQAFAPYSASYIKQLIAAGEPTQVDLRLTGAMLDAIGFEATSGGVTLTLTP